MTLIKSISGIRGTIGGKPGEGLSPFDIVKYATAYGVWVKNNNSGTTNYKVIVGRDARISGEMVFNLIAGTLTGLGIDVIDIGLATTPTVEMSIPDLEASGGIIITASHNPGEWNALKLLNNIGEFLSAADGNTILEIAENIEDIDFSPAISLGKVHSDTSQLKKHINAIIELPYVNVSEIKSAELVIAFDCVNSVGGIAIPELLTALGVVNQIPLFCDPNGLFPHNPEPLAENLTEISDLVVSKGADLAFVVDPDVDRLAIISEDGSMFGEEYTLVAVAEHILKFNKGNTVSNLSSTRALRDVTENFDGNYFASAVGEVNVVEMMKKHNAVIGGEGNGGVILPDLHYGRDALLGIALFLTHYVKSGKKCSELRKSYPSYYMSKKKGQLASDVDVDELLNVIKEKYSANTIIDIDGVKIEFEDSWVHLRKSNTEPIIRIYSEAKTQAEADSLTKRFKNEIINQT